MTDTKENILNTSLKLFARDGYEAVSVSTIAGKLGMTKGALYKHYKNKRDIFDSIVKRMYEIDEKRAQNYETPKYEYEKQPEEYKTVSLHSFARFTLAQFEFWTQDEFAADFRKMLMLEQYRSGEMAQLYKDCILSGPVKYTEDIFREMIKNGVLHDADPKQLAVEFYSPLYLLINLSDHTESKAEYKALLEKHIENFIEKRGLLYEKN